MVQPSHPGNVGSAARALKTMGFTQLALVDPRYPDIQSLPEAISLASGASCISTACTCPVASLAATAADIVIETLAADMSERGATRMDDQTSEASMEKRKKDGYF